MACSTSTGQTTTLPVELDGRYRTIRAEGFSDVPIATKGAWLDGGAAAPAFLLSLVEAEAARRAPRADAGAPRANLAPGVA